MKHLIIDGEITPEMLKNIALQVEEQKIEAGDKIDVLFNSTGGFVDVGLALAEFLKGLQADGIELRAVANGKVWSSAVLPFLACDERVAIKGSSILVHNATVCIPANTDLSAAELDEIKKNIEAYTETMADFYEDHGVPDEIVKHLYSGGDKTISENELIENGFISEFIEAVKSATNWVKRAFDRLMPVQPVFSYIQNHKQFTNQTNEPMTKTQVEAAISDKMDGFKADILNGVREILNEAAGVDPTEVDPMNESTAMTAEKLSKLEGVLYETPAEIEGNDEVVALAHPSKDVEKDHFVIPIKADGEVVRLAEGDHPVKIDGEMFVIHSTGKDWYLHANGVEDNAPNGEENTPEPPENQSAAPTVVEPEATRPRNNKPSAAPVNRRPVIPANQRVEHLRKLALQFGEGGAGRAIKK